MKHLLRVKNQFNEKLENFSEGWSRLKDSARTALTRFTRKDKLYLVENGESLQQCNNDFWWSLLPLDLYENNDSIYIRIEVPGMSKEDLNIHVTGDQLIIEGNKSIRREGSKDQFYFMECAYGYFSRMIPLPCKVNDMKAKALYKHGVLNITLPKITDTKKILVNVN